MQLRCTKSYKTHSLLGSNIINQYNNKNVNLSTVEMMTIDNCN